MPQFVWIGGTGCLLPLLIFFNLLFGRPILGSTRMWLGIEVVLILIFLININSMARKINKQFELKARQNRGKVVDIQGQVVDEEKKLK